MDFWSTRLTIDDASWAFVNAAIRCVSAIRLDCKRWGVKHNAVLKNRHKGQRAFIIGNGPSVGETDLGVLADEVCFAVNRGFKHPDYAKVQPAYHVIVDPKLADGTWPLSWLDEIVEKNKDVTFLLNAKWATLAPFKDAARKHRIHWLPTHLFFTPWTRRPIDLTRLTVGGGAVEQCIVSAIYMGCNPIYLLGHERNGFFLRVAGKASHFYGSNTDDDEYSTTNLAYLLYSAGLGFRRIRDIADFAKHQEISIVNLTPGGLVDCFPRKTLDEVLKK